MQLLTLTSMTLLLGRTHSTHGECNGCKLKLGSCMERRSRPGRTACKGSMRKRCTARSCKVRLLGGKHCLEAHTCVLHCMTNSIAHVVSLGARNWWIDELSWAGGSLAEVPGVYQNSDTLLLKQASHRCILRVLGS